MTNRVDDTRRSRLLHLRPLAQISTGSPSADDAALPLSPRLPERLPWMWPRVEDTRCSRLLHLRLLAQIMTGSPSAANAVFPLSLQGRRSPVHLSPFRGHPSQEVSGILSTAPVNFPMKLDEGGLGPGGQDRRW